MARARHLLERVGHPLGIERVGRTGESERFGAEGVIARRLCTGKELLSVIDRERRTGPQHRQV
jgi:hypothetical protein